MGQLVLWFVSLLFAGGRHCLTGRLGGLCTRLFHAFQGCGFISFLAACTRIIRLLVILRAENIRRETVVNPGVGGGPGSDNA